MGRIVRPPFYVHTSPSVNVTEPKLPVGPDSLAACLDIRRGFVEQSKPPPFLCACHHGLPQKGVHGSSADQLGQGGHPSLRPAIIAGCATPFEPLALVSRTSWLHKFRKLYNCAYPGSHLAADPSGLKAFQVAGITCTFLQRLSVCRGFWTSCPAPRPPYTLAETRRTSRMFPDRHSSGESSAISVVDVRSV